MNDSYGRKITYLRLSVTELCNLRCRYCMPEEGVVKKRHDEMMSEEEMITAVRAAASIGITKLRITGGEPLVKRNVVSVCRRAAEVPGINELCLTTNGILLPEMARPLRDAGVSRVNISLDTLDAAKYADITRVGRLGDALRGIETAVSVFPSVKINTVLIGGFNDGEARALAELTLQYPVDVRFIELMPMGGAFGESAYIPCAEVLKVLPEAVSEDCSDGVARLYRLPGAKGNIGLISPLSNHFCASCNRIRLTADGKVKPCLHSPAEFSLKGLDFEGMKAQFMLAVGAKPECHDVLSAVKKSGAGRAMNRIGG